MRDLRQRRAGGRRAWVTVVTRTEAEYYDHADVWNDRSGWPKRLAWHSLHCACPRCLQSDFNAYYTHGLKLEVSGI